MFLKSLKGCSTVFVYLKIIVFYLFVTLKISLYSHFSWGTYNRFQISFFFASCFCTNIEVFQFIIFIKLIEFSTNNLNFCKEQHPNETTLYIKNIKCVRYCLYNYLNIYKINIDLLNNKQ